MTARGLIIAAPNSGAGKTTITLGLLAALKRKGIAVKAAKAAGAPIGPAERVLASQSPQPGSMIVATTAAHRAEAFDATRALIDDLKATVPIWKHQIFADGGEEWVGTP